MTQPMYEITTWDVEEQRFTPQIGVPQGPYTQFGLRQALRALRSLGYTAAGADPWVYVKRVDEDVDKPPPR